MTIKHVKTSETSLDQNALKNDIYRGKAHRKSVAFFIWEVETSVKNMTKTHIFLQMGSRVLIFFL